MENKSGDLLNVFYRDDIGGIDLVWGEAGTGRSDGYGLAKLVKYHPEVLDNLQEVLDAMHITSRSENRINLESETHQATVRLTWDDKKKTWLLTAFEKKNSVPNNTTDTVKTPTGKRNDTATPQNAVSSGGKGSKENGTAKENGEKNEGLAVREVGGEEQVDSATERKMRYMMRRDLEKGTFTRKVADKYWSSDSKYRQAVVDSGDILELYEALNKLSDGILKEYGEKRVELYPKRVRSRLAQYQSSNPNEAKAMVENAGVKYQADAENYTDKDVEKLKRPLEDALTLERKFIADRWSAMAGYGGGPAARYMVLKSLYRFVSEDSEALPLEYIEGAFKETMDKFMASGQPTNFNFLNEYNKAILDEVCSDPNSIIRVESENGVSGMWVKDKVFGKKEMSLDEFVNAPLGDLLEGGRDLRAGEEWRLSEREADELISQMEEHAEAAPVLELTPENWEKEFGKDNKVATPIGEVKLGENQYEKLIKNKRESYFGMIKPTLKRPDVILEEYDPKEGAERDTKYLFVKTFIKPDGGRIVHFESVTVRKEGLEVSISSHELDGDRVKAKVQNDNILHLSKELPFSSEWRLTEAPQEEGPDLVPTSDNSEGKGSENFGNSKENGENLLFREEEPRGIRRALIYGKDRRTGEDRYVDYSRTGDDVRAMERKVAQGIKEQHPEIKSSGDAALETNSIYRTITFPNGSALRIRFSDHTPGMTARELDDSRSNYNGINWTFTVKDNDKVSGLIDLSRNRMTADDVMRFVGRMAEYDRDGYPEEMQRLIEENKEKIRSEHRGWLAPVYYADERITKAFGEDVAPLGNEEGLRFREEDEGTRPRGPLRPGEGIFDRAEAVSRDYMAELERVRKSREEAKAERPKEEREYIQAQEVKRRVDAVLEKLKNITAEHKQDEELTRRAVKALNGEMLALVNDNTPTDDPNYIEMVLLSNLVADYCDENYAMTPPTLVEMIKLRMYEMGLTQVALSKLLGINTSRISEYLNGKKMPTLSHARTISQKLDISPSIVLGV